MEVAAPEPERNREQLSQHMLQNLEKLQLPIEQLRRRIQEELDRQDST